jgi:hypothetical protein
MLSLLIIGCVSSASNHRTPFISEEDARDIAEIKIKELGWEMTTEQVVEVYWSITPWDKQYPDFKDFYNASSYYSNFNNELKGRSYWSVYYHPKDRTVHGGGLCFFIDAETGEIIDIYRGS